MCQDDPVALAFKAAAKTILISALAPEIPPLETSKIPGTRLALFNNNILNSSINSSATGLPAVRVPALHQHFVCISGRFCYLIQV